MLSKETSALYIKNFIFGVEDSLVSTVGLLSGIAAAGLSKQNILLTGTVLIFVEAFSMGIGSLLSEHSAEIYLHHKQVSMQRSAKGGAVMFFSYFISGFIPLAPYLFFAPAIALSISIALSLIFLFILGVYGARAYGIPIFRNGLEMLLLGGIAVFVGVLVGKMINF